MVRKSQTGDGSPAQKDAFSNTIEFLHFTMLEAAATQGFADALTSVSNSPWPEIVLSN